MGGNTQRRAPSSSLCGADVVDPFCQILQQGDSCFETGMQDPMRSGVRGFEVELYNFSNRD